VQGITHSFQPLGRRDRSTRRDIHHELVGLESGVLRLRSSRHFLVDSVYAFYRNTPEEHKWVNKSELAHIRGIGIDGIIHSGAGCAEKLKVPWGTLLTTPNMWYVVSSWVC